MIGALRFDSEIYHWSLQFFSYIQDKLLRCTFCDLDKKNSNKLEINTNMYINEFTPKNAYKCSIFVQSDTSSVI